VHPAPAEVGQPAHPHTVAASHLDPSGWASSPVYTLAKYGMSLLALGWAAEFAEAGNRVEHAVAADDHRDRGGAEPAWRGRTAMSRAAARRSWATAPSRSCNAGRAVHGNTYIDVDVLAEEGVTDLSKYGGGDDMMYDLYVDPPSN